ncbi:zinc-ribbon domain-containing protein [Butyrivibrio sp. AE3004]|uniref:zinc-ribbon domain-containing protein n=1 Tax=Butyrivibrio sp. AE3004 TaxID=1506994 RepID=UPI0004945C5F|nr:zinc-ribbon domain-containing protein [Butyrivibrio sp. AE3004]
MQCIYCGKEISDNSKFCTKCGKELKPKTRVWPNASDEKTANTQMGQYSAGMGTNPIPDLNSMQGSQRVQNQIQSKMIIAIGIGTALLIALILAVIVSGSRRNANKAVLTQDDTALMTEENIKDSMADGNIKDSVVTENSVVNENDADAAPVEQSTSKQSEDESKSEDFGKGVAVEQELVSSNDSSEFKISYISIIENEYQKYLAGAPDDYEYNMETIDGYCLYDIDKDGIPELFIRYGHDEASYHGVVYTYRDGALKVVENSLPLGHTYLESDPGENGVLLCFGHMGYGGITRAVLKGEMLEYEELLNEDLNEKIEKGEDVSYTEPDELVPGAYYLEEYSADNILPIKIYSESSNELSLSTGEDFPFYGVYVAAFNDIEKAQVVMNELLSIGFDSCIVVSSKWDNLNSDTYYCVAAGKCLYESDANELLKRVRASGYSDAYVKYSGELR